jgi:2-succinyl-6-hydroxy-2,4-cyclohexadiene-1-carboxylate synthase
MPTAKINGIEMHFELHGEQGEPLVLVHGYTGDITDWRHQLPEFSRTHRVLIMDHRGHGRSEAPADRDLYTVPHMADDIEALVDLVGFDRYHLLGHSMGGAVSQEIALRSPGRLISLTLEDTSNGFKPAGASDGPMAKWNAMRHQLAETKGMAAVAELPGLPIAPHMAERKAEEKQRLARMAVDGFLGAQRGLDAWQGTMDRAHAISVPTLVVIGTSDVPFIVKASRWLAEAIPGAELVEIENAAHSPQYEQPASFNAAVRRHIERNAGAGAK